MITKITTQNFKGLTFEQPLARLTLFVAPNGTGKSARTQALELARMGFLPGYKTSRAIFGAFGKPGVGMVVGFESDSGKTYSRKYNRSNRGAISCKYIANGNYNFPKEDFAVAISDQPKIFDLPAFMALSDQKKIDMVFALFPPAGDIGKIEGEIQTLTDSLNKKVVDQRASEKTIQTLATGRAKIELPVGTLAEIQAEIKTTRAEYRAAAQSLKEIEIREAGIKAKAEAEEKAAADKKRVAAEQKTRDAEAAKKAASLAADRSALATREKQIAAAEARLKARAPAGGRPGLPTIDPAQAVQAILNTLQKAGCTTCAASLVAKKQLRLINGGKVVTNG